VYGTAPVSGGRLFVPSSTGGSVTAFSVRGRPLWSFHTGSYVYSSPAAWAGRVVFGSYNGVLYCLSAGSGRLLWTVRMGGSISGAPVIVDGVAYAASFANRTVGVDIRKGRVIFRFPHGEYVPVSGNGARLLLHGYSRIWAIEPRRR
jgi:outer membrane protein assembly factor BamB